MENETLLNQFDNLSIKDGLSKVYAKDIEALKWLFYRKIIPAGQLEKSVARILKKINSKKALEKG